MFESMVLIEDYWFDSHKNKKRLSKCIGFIIVIVRQIPKMFKVFILEDRSLKIGNTCVLESPMYH